MRLFGVRPVGVREAIGAALRRDDGSVATSRWFDAVSSVGPPPARGPAGRHRPIVDARERAVTVPAIRAFEPIEEIGGERGWYAFDWMWRVRGAIDRLLGGVGMRRGRGPAEHLRPGAVIDFWRVEAFERGRLLRLEAEMKLPGRAWLDFEVCPDGEHARLTQTATFDPVGLWGLAYWYGVWPLHQLVFAGMLRGLARAAEKRL
jgi:hypothetical protein